MIEPEEGDDHSSDEDFSPGHLIIDMADDHHNTINYTQQGYNNLPDQCSTPLSTAGSDSPMATPPINQGITSGDDFKGLTFVGKMDIDQPPVPSDTLCLYSYHWGSTHLDVITRKTGISLIPMKNVYGRVVPGLTRNAVSNRIPKIGAKTIALPDTHISTLKKLQLPITARSHYLTVDDFIKLCFYYKKAPPTNLANFVNITAADNPAEVLKIFNAQKPSVSQPVLTTPTQQSQNGSIKVESLFDHSEFSLMSPGQLNANLANSVGNILQYATPYPNWNATPPNIPQTPPTPKQSSAGASLSPTGSEFHSLVLPDGTQIALVIQNSTPYLLNAELQHLLPQANQNIIGPLRSLLNIPLEYASRPNMNALKEVGVIGIKACRAIVYKISDVIKMYSHWRIPVPRFLNDLNNGKIPRGVVDMTPVSQNTTSGPISQPNNTPISTTPISIAPISADMMSPSGVRINFGRTERKNSHSGPMQLDDQYVEYEYLPWGNDRVITLLKQPTGEPYVAIAELVDKIFSHRNQISIQKRTKLGVSTLPATSIQIHALRARCSIDPSSGYSKLVSLSGVLLLAREAGIIVPVNVYEECQKHISIPLETLFSAPPTPLRKVSDQQSSIPTDQIQPQPLPVTPNSSATPPLTNKPSFASLPHLREDIKNHPDIILPAKLGLRSAEGILYQVMWGKSKIVIFTSARGINYIGLYQIYDVLFTNLVSRMNFKMRMRKLGIKSIRAPPAIRLNLIKLGALPTSSPVCGLLRISEMDRLVRSYNMTPPTVFHDLFLSKRGESSMKSDDYKDFCNPPGGSAAKRPHPFHHTMELVPHLSSSDQFKGLPDQSLVVSLPRALVVVDHSHIIMSPHTEPGSYTESGSHIDPGSLSNKPSFHKTSILQNLAKKISQKNHKLAAAATTSTRQCPSCGRVYPSAKKRCEPCGIYLIGRPCPSCSTINYSRCTQCTRCAYALDPSTFKSNKQNHIAAFNQFTKTEVVNNMNDMSSSSIQQFVTPTLINKSYDSDMSDNDSVSPSFSAPPIRAAVLKKMFPDQNSSQSSVTGNNGGSSGVLTKTVFTGTVGSTRTCLECDAINSKMAKKCQQCRAPLQGRPCLKCSRPNHSHSTECYKCGTTLPPTATKWIVGGKIVRTSNESSVVNGMTNAELNKEVSRRAPITCIRCDRMKQKGRFKCGRCGDLYTLSPLIDDNGKIIKKKKHDRTNQSSSRDSMKLSEDLLSLSHNLYTLGVGKELVPYLTDKEKEYWELLAPAEQELEAMEEEYNKLSLIKTTHETQFSDIQAELDALIVQAESINKQLMDLKKTEETAIHSVDILPDQIKKLEHQMTALNKIFSVPLP